MQFIRKMLKDSKGATAIEYGLIAALIAVAAIGAMGTVGNKLNTTFNNVRTSSKLVRIESAGRRDRSRRPLHLRQLWCVQ